jgi:hypothetical protein
MPCWTLVEWQSLATKEPEPTEESQSHLPLYGSRSGVMPFGGGVVEPVAS